MNKLITDYQWTENLKYYQIMNRFLIGVKCVPFLAKAVVSVVDAYYSSKRCKLDYKEYENDVNCRIRERSHKSDLICNSTDNRD